VKRNCFSAAVLQNALPEGIEGLLDPDKMNERWHATG